MSASVPDADEPAGEEFLQDVLAGLARRPPLIPPKYFYDARGSELFDRICELPEYYLTRTELEIMTAHAGEMAAAIGPGALVVEPGSGSSLKVRPLLDHLAHPAGYVPVEICGEHLAASAASLRRDYPGVDILPVNADFTRDFPLPRPAGGGRRRVIYFPGSTLGNFPPAEARDLLGTLHRLAGPDGMLLLGVDLRKDPAVLVPAYDDSAGVTAAFNLNLLTRINRELGGDFDTRRFQHRAVWNDAESRIEMHLVSLAEQTVSVAGECFHFRRDDHIITEYSYKYTPAALHNLARGAGFVPTAGWSDRRSWFSVQLLHRN